MAGMAGLEPVTSTVTGWHSNQLSYIPAITCDTFKINKGKKNGGNGGTRTRNIHRDRVAL